MGRQRLLADGRHRVGHRQDPAHPGRRRRRPTTLVTYLHLWDHVGDELPKKAPQERRRRRDWVPPDELEGALQSLYRSYETALRALGDASSQPLGEPPPVFIVVCPNTIVSKLVFDWIAGEQVVERRRASSPSPASSRCSPTSTTASLARAAAHDPRRLRPARVRRGAEGRLQEGRGRTRSTGSRQEYRRRNPGADVDKLTDEDLLREVMNTVGKRGKLGEHVRCVVSVSMLTEGWDANTVTHILGIRALRQPAPLRAGRRPRPAPPLLRRRTTTGASSPSTPRSTASRSPFIPADKPITDPLPPNAGDRGAGASRAASDLRIDVPEARRLPRRAPRRRDLRSTSTTRPSFDDRPEHGADAGSRCGGVVGERELEEGDPTQSGPQQVAFALAKRILDAQLRRHDGDQRPWLFPQLVEIVPRVARRDGRRRPAATRLGLSAASPRRRRSPPRRCSNAIVRQAGNRRERLRPMLRRFDPDGSTDDVDFLTRKASSMPTEKSQVNHVVLDGTGRQHLGGERSPSELELQPERRSRT